MKANDANWFQQRVGGNRVTFLSLKFSVGRNTISVMVNFSCKLNHFSFMNYFLTL